MEAAGAAGAAGAEAGVVAAEEDTGVLGEDDGGTHVGTR